MRTRVIILAQGSQRRLGLGYPFKQLLPLPACGNVPILGRTLRQLGDPFARLSDVTVVTWEALIEQFPPAWAGLVTQTNYAQLADPGNSSLRGLSRYLEQVPDHDADATVVLLGDVVYSWACLRACWSLLDGPGMRPGMGFVGTSGLSASGGEVWGVAWREVNHYEMMTDLRAALRRHPPFEDTYQPGQLRRWITGDYPGDLTSNVERRARLGEFIAIDDYTMDVDLMEHISKLDFASVSAAADDAKHDLVWRTNLA